MKLAILYSGAIRTLPETIENNIAYFENCSIDLYFSTWDHIGYSDRINSPDYKSSNRKFDSSTKINKEFIENLCSPFNVNIKRVHIETYDSNNHHLDLTNGLDNGGLAAQYYKILDCYNLLEHTAYDAIIRLRCDMLLNNRIGMRYLIDNIKNDKIVFPSSIWYNHFYEKDSNSINEMCWISNKTLMQKACNIYNNTDKINTIIATKKYTHPNYGEGICFMNLEVEEISNDIVTFDFDYQILR